MGRERFSKSFKIKLGAAALLITSYFGAAELAENTQKACGFVARLHTVDLLSSPQRLYFGASIGYHETALFPYPGESRTAFLSTRYNGLSITPEFRLGELGGSLLIIGGSASNRYLYDEDPLPRQYVSLYGACKGFPQRSQNRR